MNGIGRLMPQKSCVSRIVALIIAAQLITVLKVFDLLVRRFAKIIYSDVNILLQDVTLGQVSAGGNLSGGTSTGATDLTLAKISDDV